MIGIYKITSPSGKIYIGQSVDINKRIKFYRLGHLKNQTALMASFKKYGFDNHKFEVIEECDIERLNERERYWQDYYEVLRYGLNCRLTKFNDKSGKLSDKTKRKISESRIGEKNPNFGKPIPLERKMKISEIAKVNMSRGNNHRSKIAIDLDTGIYFSCLKDLAEAYNLNYHTLKHRMRYGKNERYKRYRYV